MSETPQNDADPAEGESITTVASDTQNSELIKSEDQAEPRQTRRGRPPKPEQERQTIQLGARITERLYDWLMEIAAYEGSIEHTEVVRYALLDMTRRYRQDPFFLRWLQMRVSQGSLRAQRLLGEEA